MTAGDPPPKSAEVTAAHGITIGWGLGRLPWRVPIVIRQVPSDAHRTDPGGPHAPPAKTSSDGVVTVIPAVSVDVGQVDTADQRDFVVDDD